MEWKKGNFNRVLFIFFILYVSALTWIVLFKLTVPSNIVSLSRDRVINVIPFFEVITGEYFDTFDMIANIIAFIPFGIYTALVLKEIPTRSKLISAAVLSILYETVQFVFAIGVCAITDVIMNTLGAYIGILVYEFINSKTQTEYKTKKFVTVCSAISIIPMGTVLGIVSVGKNIIL